MTCSPAAPRSDSGSISRWSASSRPAVPPVDNTRVYVTLRNAQTLLGKPDMVGRIEVELADSDRAPVGYADRFEQMFGYDAESWQETNANFLGIFAMQNTIINFVVGAILARRRLRDPRDPDHDRAPEDARHRHPAKRRFPPQRHPPASSSLQGAIIATIGGAIGDVVGHYVLVALSHLKTHQEGLVKSEYFLVYDDPRFYVYGVAFALLVGIVASLIPAIRGSRVEPVDVLRGQLG